MIPLTLDASSEQIAINFLRSLQWHDQGFLLFFLFADIGPSSQLANWLSQRLIPQGKRIHHATAPNDFAEQPESAVDALIDLGQTLSNTPSTLWYDMQRYPSDRHWNQARNLFLARLNERRARLERDMQCPLVLVLPTGFRPDARTIAPDLWHIRALSEELRITTPGTIEQSEAPLPIILEETTSPDTPTPAYDEWQRLQTTATAEQIYLPICWRAVEELLAAGRPADAEVVARTGESLARQQISHNSSPAQMRDLSVSLDKLGLVAQARGEWQQAEAVYRESLEITRQLLQQLGRTPEALRDLSVSLDNVGRVAQARGEWQQAEAVYRESLEIARQLLQQLGGTPDALRDLSISLDNVGRVTQARGEWRQAQAIYRESLEIRRQLLQQLGGTPNALRDLSVSLDNVGRVAQARGDWQQAEAVYRESLEIARQLLQQLGRTPEALRDLSVSLDNVGHVAQARGDWQQAESAYDESLKIRRQLLQQLGGTPDALRGLSVSLDNVGRVALARGEWQQAEAAYLESLEITQQLIQQLIQQLGETPEALRDLSISLNNLGIVAQAQGDQNSAMDYYTAIVDLPHAPANLRAQALLQRGLIKAELGDYTAATVDYSTVIDLPDAPPDMIEDARQYLADATSHIPSTPESP